MMSGARTRILIVDDSAVMRSLLRSIVMADGGLEVAGTAADGATALAVVESLEPDLVLLDVEMPVMDGVATLKELRRRGHKMPVIMCSSLTRRGARVTVEALASGASDCVTKPAGQPGRQEAVRLLSQELTPKIHALAGKVRPQPPTPALPAVAPRLPQAGPLFLPPLKTPITAAAPTVLAIGVSTGGPAALDLLLPALPADFPLPVLIVQHMPELFTRLIAERLDARCRLRVKEASEAEPVSPGTIWFARGNWHMEVMASPAGGTRATLHLSQGPLENHCRPAVDVLFRSAARTYGGGVLGVVLTGMGADGMSGCRAIREQGGTVLAQDEATSTVWGMPGAVVHAGLAHKVLPLDAMAEEIVRNVRRARDDSAELLRRVV
jgi:two-component system, chemotaxis family, protein-glutamate methylesterase/glutaminase